MLLSDQQEGLLHVAPGAVGPSLKGSLITESLPLRRGQIVFPSQEGLVALKTWGQWPLLCLLSDAQGGQDVFPKGLVCPEAAAYWLAGHSTPTAGKTPLPLKPPAPKVFTRAHWGDSCRGVWYLPGES